MRWNLRSVVVLVLGVSVLGAFLGCGSGSGDESPAHEAPAAVEEAGTAPAEDGGEGSDTGAATMEAAWKAAAASQGIYTGEIPDGFPVEFVPPHPDGTIDRSALQDGEATLLQKVPGTVDEVYAHYKSFYEGLGWSAGDPMTIAGRTLGGFSGDGAQVDITLTDQEDGTTFVSLALH